MEMKRLVKGIIWPRSLQWRSYKTVLCLQISRTMQDVSPQGFKGRDLFQFHILSNRVTPKNAN